jgi:biotin carboxylase
MPTVVLVLPASSYRGPDFVSAAEDLGVDLLVATDAELPLTGGAIRETIKIDCADERRSVAAIVSAAAEADAVVGVDDAGVFIAAKAADELGLPHDDPKAVAATRDKAEMRRLLHDAGVKQARFALVENLEEAATAAAGIGYPVVLKPRTLSGSRGVVRIDSAEDLPGAFDRVMSIARRGGADSPLLIEEYLPGDEVAVEGLVDSRGVEVLAVFDKPDSLDGPYFEETIYVTPSRHRDDVLAAVEATVAQAVAALGLAHGPIHAELRLTPAGPRVVEVAARSIGGLCGRSLRFGMLGQSLEVLLLRAALGMNRRGMRRDESPSGVMMLPIPAAGVFRGVRGEAALGEVEGITDLQITFPRDRPIEPLPEGDRYLGFMFAEGDSPGAVESALREAWELLEVVID